MYYSHKKQLIPKLVSFSEALQKMANYCAYQERCHYEIENKLKEFKLIPEAKEKIIIYLIEEDFINETRFAQSFARGKFKFKKWGRNRIINELKQRKISDYNIKKGLKEVDDQDYLKSFEMLSTVKWEKLQNEPLLKAKQKFISYFQYRGWEKELIFDKLNLLCKNKL